MTTRGLEVICNIICMYLNMQIYIYIYLFIFPYTPHIAVKLSTEKKIDLKMYPTSMAAKS